MLVMFLEATAALFSGLLDNVFWGSVEPGVAGVTGSLASVIEGS